jgi:hypothetical protein
VQPNVSGAPCKCARMCFAPAQAIKPGPAFAADTQSKMNQRGLSTR